MFENPASSSTIFVDIVPLGEQRNTQISPLPSVVDDLIFTDFEGSSHLQSNSDFPENEDAIYDDVEFGIDQQNSSNDSSSSPILDVRFDAIIADQDNNPAEDKVPSSSLVSNVFFEDVLSASTDDHHHPPIASTSITEMPYPTRRALLRRQNRIKPIMSKKRKPYQHSRKTHPKSVSVSTPRLPESQSAGPSISLEDVAGRTEDTYFALSLVGSLERLTARKRATAKLHILQYLTELAFAED